MPSEGTVVERLGGQFEGPEVDRGVPGADQEGGAAAHPS